MKSNYWESLDLEKQENYLLQLKNVNNRGC